MKKQVRHTIRLTSDEVKEAVREYIALHSCGETHPANEISVFMITEDQGKHGGVEIEADWFE